MPCVAVRNVVITGANSGIGLETAVALAARGDRVVICCRSAERAAVALEDIRARSGNDEVAVVPLDLADSASIRSAAAELSTLGTIDVLINNAGLILSSRSETVDGFETTFGVNHLGHMLLTLLLESPLRAARDPRVINVASVAHWFAVGGLDFDDLQTTKRYNPWLAYGRSKLANVHFTHELARRWPDVAVNCLHPGSVNSGFARDGDTTGPLEVFLRAMPLVSLDAAAGAATSVFLATSDPGRRITGRYWVRNHIGRLAPPARRREDDEALWETSVTLLAPLMDPPVALDAPLGSR